MRAVICPDVRGQKASGTPNTVGVSVWVSDLTVGRTFLDGAANDTR